MLFTQIFPIFFQFKCEIPYRKKAEHKMNCGHKCLNCLEVCKMLIIVISRFEVGPIYPCPSINEAFSCLDCFKTFANNECFNRHKKFVCKKHKKCLDCGVFYSLVVNKKNGRSGHKCAEKFCKKCYRK